MSVNEGDNVGFSLRSTSRGTVSLDKITADDCLIITWGNFPEFDVTTDALGGLNARNAGVGD